MRTHVAAILLVPFLTQLPGSKQSTEAPVPTGSLHDDQNQKGRPDCGTEAARGCFVIELGPEGGHAGGQIVVTGTPEQVVACKASHTGRCLKSHLGGR